MARKALPKPRTRALIARVTVKEKRAFAKAARVRGIREADLLRLAVQAVLATYLPTGSEPAPTP